MDDEKLVESVRAFNSLWKVGSKSYRDIRAKENAWKEVANKMGEGVTADQCSYRWKALRDKFVCELKKKTKSGDPGPPLTSCWPLFSIMSFLTDTVKHKTTTSNLTSPKSEDIEMTESSTETHESDHELGNHETVSTPSVSNPSSRQSSIAPGSDAGRLPHKKRRHEDSHVDEVDTVLLKKLDGLQQQDGEGAFGEHVASCLRQMNPRQKALARIEIDKVLLNIQFPEDPYSTNPYYFFN